MPSKQKSAQPKGASKASVGKPATIDSTARTGQAKAAGTGQASTAVAAMGASGDAISLLKQDHRKVDALFTQYETPGADKAALRRQICNELVIHTLLEEELFYPACRQHADEADDKLDEAQVEHDSAKMLITELLEAADDDEYLDAKVKVLAEQIRTHVKEEEAADGLFAKAQAAGLNNPDLANRLRSRKSALQQLAQVDDLPEPQVISFQHAIAGTPRTINPQLEEDMSRGNYSGRDDRGRFTGDDDRGYGRGGNGRGNDDSYRTRSRDDEGRFTSRGRDDDDYRRSSRSSDDRDHGRGGWFGDPQGHSEASRRGWESRDDDRGRYSSRGRDDDDYRRSSRSSDDRDHGRGGWFGDPEGHSEASRRGWDSRDDDRGGRSSSRGRDDDDYRRSSRSSGDRGQGGWFGDPEGHSEASRRGWESRDDDRGRYSSRSRDYDDDRRYARGRDDDDGRGHGRGGWFGDPEGHSQASRRGWENR